MAWFLVIERSTGRLFSQGEILATPLPARFRSVDVGTKPNDEPGGQMWDEATETFVNRPTKVVRDRTDDILDDPQIAALNPGVRNRLRTLIDAEFTPIMRFYNVATGKSRDI